MEQTNLYSFETTNRDDCVNFVNQLQDAKTKSGQPCVRTLIEQLHTALDRHAETENLLKTVQVANADRVFLVIEKIRHMLRARYRQFWDSIAYIKHVKDRNYAMNALKEVYFEGDMYSSLGRGLVIDHRARFDYLTEKDLTTVIVTAARVANWSITLPTILWTVSPESDQWNEVATNWLNAQVQQTYEHIRANECVEKHPVHQLFTDVGIKSVIDYLNRVGYEVTKMNTK